MKRQKRDRLERAHARGYQAALHGHSTEQCPYNTISIREQWLGGWREGRTSIQENALRTV